MMSMYTVQVYKHAIDTVHHTSRNESESQNFGENIHTIIHKRGFDYSAIPRGVLLKQLEKSAFKRVM